MSAADGMSESTPDHVMAALNVALRFALLAQGVSAPFLTDRQRAALQVSVSAFGVVMDAIHEQTDIADIDMASLDAQEVLILAADAKAQADAAAAGQG